MFKHAQRACTYRSIHNCAYVIEHQQVTPAQSYSQGSRPQKEP
jgi:hypothetical protein